MWNAREWEQAEAQFKRVLERWPDYDDAKMELAWTFVDSGRPELAFPLYEERGAKPHLGSDYLSAWVASGGSGELREFLEERKSSYLVDGKKWLALGI